MNAVEIILLTILILIIVIITVYVLAYNNLQTYTIKINEAESVIDELLRRKYDLLNNLKNNILSDEKIPEKTFDEYLKLKKINISSFDFERKLTEYYNLIVQIKDDYEEISKDEEFSKNYDDIYEVNEKLEAAKSFYNKYTTLLNKAIKKVPTNIIARLHHIKVKAYFDGKDMFDDDLKDFKL